MDLPIQEPMLKNIKKKNQLQTMLNIYLCKNLKGYTKMLIVVISQCLNYKSAFPNILDFPYFNTFFFVFYFVKEDSILVFL